MRSAPATVKSTSYPESQIFATFQSGRLTLQAWNVDSICAPGLPDQVQLHLTLIGDPFAIGRYESYVHTAPFAGLH